VRPVCVVVLVLVACGPAPSIAPPGSISCPALERSIVGTWTREGTVMEIRADGAIVRNTIEGAFRWVAPGRATVDIRGSHEEHALGMITPVRMLDVDANDRAVVWSRVSPPPAAPDACFDVRGSVIGRWTDGAETESFDANGSYERGSRRGTWQMVEAGTLDLRVGESTTRYRIALASPTLLVSTPESGVDAARGTLVESRLP
jgi:hypothetical protein